MLSSIVFTDFINYTNFSVNPSVTTDITTIAVQETRAKGNVLFYKFIILYYPWILLYIAYCFD